MRDYYHRNLPHYQPAGGEFFITFRLANSLPKAVISQLKQEKKEALEKISPKDKVSVADHYKRYFGKFDHLLDHSMNGEPWLNQDEIAKIVSDKLHEFHNQKYKLISFCIMPNHVHLLFKLPKLNSFCSLPNSFPVTEVMRLIKGATAFQANKVLKRNGQFWQHESYDHLVRDNQERENIIRYILLNPVKAGLIGNWWSWKWSYCKDEYKELLM